MTTAEITAFVQSLNVEELQTRLDELEGEVEAVKTLLAAAKARDKETKKKVKDKEG